MKCKLRYYISLLFLFIFVFFSSFIQANAQSITPTNFLIKNSNNTAILYQSSNRDYFSSSPYYSGKFEINLGNTNVENNHSYGLDFYLTMYVAKFSDYGNFGYGSPELYINNNGLHQTSFTISAFTNTQGSCSNVVCPYQLHLSFTFATQYQGTLYVALPYDIPFDTYGWTLNTMELTNYGQNTTNSDIIANNNQNTQNIIANNNQNTQSIINNQNSISNQIINNSTQNTQAINDNLNDDTGVSNNTISDFIDNIPTISNGPISQLIQIPLTILNDLINIFGGNNSCPGAISFGSLLGTQLTLPCLDIEQKLGSTIYNFIDISLTLYILFNTFMLMVHSWETWTSFNDDFSSLYTGKHTAQGYTPRHGGDS